MAKKKPDQPATFSPVEVDIELLRPHPRNYREHPEDQLAHIVASIKAHGFYRNVVVAEDNTVLAGHGVVLASRQMGLKTIPVIRLPIGPDDPRAISVLTGDNEIGSLAMVNDRLLTELLRELAHTDVGLLGTGFDPPQLAALAMMTRPASELRDANEAAEWLGMPEYGTEVPNWKLIINFTSVEDRQKYCEETGLKILKREQNAWSTRWPFEAQHDLAATKFEG